jgi:hypothetical protein
LATVASGVIARMPATAPIRIEWISAIGNFHPVSADADRTGSMPARQ